MPRAAVILMLFWAVAASATHPVLAQNTIAYGQTVSGEIDNRGFREVYTFQGAKGEIIAAQMQRTRGNLDPLLILFDDQNQLVARTDDSGLTLTVRLNTITLPHTGVYFLVATRFGQERGMTTGAYSLNLQRVGLAADPRIEAGGAIALRYGDSVVGEISDARYEYYYTFGALRGDLITISMNRISGEVDCMLILPDSEGRVLIISDDDPASTGTLDAAISNWRVQTSGNFIIAATRFGREAGTSRGAFSLSLTKVTTEDLGLSAENASLIDYGASASGRIDKATLRRYYLIQATQGDILTIEAIRQKGNLDPVLELYTGDMQQRVAVDTGTQGRIARIDSYRVPITGAYILVISRFNDDKGATEGDFTLTLTARRGAQ